jgi:pSer/pThr/pTyr-binding forkhead associated (FHA) protein
MNVKLKILRGKLQTQKHKQALTELEIRGPRFVIGSAADCSLRCPSQTVSSHHCEILISDEEVVVRDLYSESGTYVNDTRVDHEAALSEGDRIRVGRLEFEARIDKSAATPSPRATPQQKSDPVSELVSEMLVEADEVDRAKRLEDPETRQFHLEPAAANAASEAESAESQPDAKKKKKKPPAKKPPGKLPPPPPFTADDTVSAAEETLKKLFTKEKK